MIVQKPLEEEYALLNVMELEALKMKERVDPLPTTLEN